MIINIFFQIIQKKINKIYFQKSKEKKQNLRNNKKNWKELNNYLKKLKINK